MRRLPQNLSLLAVSLLTMGSIAAAPVYAEDGGSSSMQNMTSTSVESESHGSGVSNSSKGRAANTLAMSESTQTETEIEAHGGSLRAEAQKLLATKRQEGKTKSVQARQQACEAHKAELTTRQSNYARNAQKHLDVFNGIYDKVLAFQADKKLDATDFASLKATADTQKAAAAAAVAAISDASVTIDCTSQDPAVGVATLKTAVANARTALQGYRTAIKNVVNALAAANDHSGTSAHIEPAPVTGGAQ